MAVEIPAILALVSSGVDAYGKHQQGKADEEQAQQQAVLDQQEGKIAEQQSLVSEDTQRKASREFLGRQAAAFSEAGVGPGSSTAVMNQSAINAELDALNVRYRGKLVKFGYDYNANSTMIEGQTKRRNANLAAGGSLLRGASEAYGKS